MLERLFDLADKVSLVIQKTIKTAYIERSDPKQQLYMSFFCKIVNSFDSSMILIKKGYNQDAGTVARSMLECLFVLKACMLSSDYFEKFLSTHSTSINYFIKRQSSFFARKDNDKETRNKNVGDYLARLEALKDDYKDATGVRLDFYDAAKVSKLEDMYDIYYNLLSMDCVHPTFRSLDLLVESDCSGEIERIKAGPNFGLSKKMILIVAHIIITSLNCINSEFKLGLDDDIDSLFSEFKVINR